MYPTVLVMLVGWIPVVLLLFAVLPPRRAVITAFVFAWLFLPVAGYKLPGLPDYTKVSATCVGVLLGSVLFDFRRYSGLRASPLDVAMLVWCAVPMATSISNGLGAYDGMSSMLAPLIAWGLPYLIGRVYFSDLKGLRELAIGIMVGGLVYVPFCLWEIKMSPSLHKLAYGFHQHSFLQTKRALGFRPMVFMQHGLMVGMWMTSASLAGAWLYLAGGLKRLGSVPMFPLLCILGATAALCQSFGAIALLVIGAVAIWLTWKLRMSLPLLVLVALPILYMGTRGSGAWSGMSLVDMSGAIAGGPREGSLRVRIENENVLIGKALQRPLLGWGGWNRNRVLDERGRDRTIADGMWVIVLGQQGLIGLGAVTIAMLGPVIVVLRRYPPRVWKHPAIAGASVLATLLVLYCIDCLFNAMANPIFMVAAGGLVGMRREPVGSGAGRSGASGHRTMPRRSHATREWGAGWG